MGLLGDVWNALTGQESEADQRRAAEREQKRAEAQLRAEQERTRALQAKQTALQRKIQAELNRKKAADASAADLQRRQRQGGKRGLLQFMETGDSGLSSTLGG